MSLSHRYDFTVYVNSVGLSRSVVLTADAEDNRSLVVPGAHVNYPVDLQFTASGLQGLYIVSDIDITVQFVDATTHDVVLPLTAGEPVIWYPGLGFTLFENNVSGLLFTNHNTADANVEIRCLTDATH